MTLEMMSRTVVHYVLCVCTVYCDRRICTVRIIHTVDEVLTLFTLEMMKIERLNALLRFK